MEKKNVTGMRGRGKMKRAQRLAVQQRNIWKMPLTKNFPDNRHSRFLFAEGKLCENSSEVKSLPHRLESSSE